MHSLLHTIYTIFDCLRYVLASILQYDSRDKSNVCYFTCYFTPLIAASVTRAPGKTNILPIPIRSLHDLSQSTHHTPLKVENWRADHTTPIRPHTATARIIPRAALQSKARISSPGRQGCEHGSLERQSSTLQRSNIHSRTRHTTPSLGGALPRKHQHNTGTKSWIPCGDHPPSAAELGACFKVHRR